MTLPVKILIAFIMMMGLYASGFYNGDKHATEKYLPQITQLKDAINTADLEAKKTQAQQQENYNAIKAENDKRIADIRNYYAGMLSMSSKAHSITTPLSPQANDGTPSQQATTGLDFEQACVEDALKVTEFQEWVKANHIPVQ
jgi:hypothetical protein